MGLYLVVTGTRRLQSPKRQGLIFEKHANPDAQSLREGQQPSAEPLNDASQNITSADYKKHEKHVVDHV